ncbi:hypothetical protein [Lacticaseibacillus parakribbianus]|uniref:hypothetical protein n=1 Tax=Lacticaseibacillus parakribbianus TaxID=2970927 RepID=UPI0021CB202F|nr:hypothetical protein [Lacticaseibacillus parakribbianus]
MAKRLHYVAAAALVATAASFATTRAYAYYWHHFLPNRLFKQVSAQIADSTTRTGGWINMTPDAGWVADHLVATYRGGITTANNTFAFTVSQSGELLSLKRS